MTPSRAASPLQCLARRNPPCGRSAPLAGHRFTPDAPLRSPPPPYPPPHRTPAPRLPRIRTLPASHPVRIPPLATGIHQGLPGCINIRCHWDPSRLGQPRLPIPANCCSSWKEVNEKVQTGWCRKYLEDFI
uniref:Uncharacterized protein n=1 Tax=Arundo donax TaxID=35708 RepID=A0A0A8XQU1_ARUDO